jgi:hypothetical protein
MLIYVICVGVAIIAISLMYKRITEKRLEERDAKIAAELAAVTKDPVGVIVPEQSVKSAPKPAVVKETKPEPVPEPVVKETKPEPVVEIKTAPAKAKTSGRPKKKK